MAPPAYEGLPGTYQDLQPERVSDSGQHGEQDDQEEPPPFDQVPARPQRTELELLATAEAEGDKRAGEGLLALYLFLDWVVEVLPGVLGELGLGRVAIDRTGNSFFEAWIAADEAAGDQLARAFGVDWVTTEAMRERVAAVLEARAEELKAEAADLGKGKQPATADSPDRGALRELAGIIREDEAWPGEPGLIREVLEASAEALGPVTVLGPKADDYQLRFGDHGSRRKPVYLIQVGGHFDATRPLPQNFPRPAPASRDAATGPEAEQLRTAAERLQEDFEREKVRTEDDLARVDPDEQRSFQIQAERIDERFRAVLQWPASPYRNKLLEELLSSLQRLHDEFRRTAKITDRELDTKIEALRDALLADADPPGDEQAREGLLALWRSLDWAVRRLPGVLAGLGRKRLRMPESASRFFLAWIAADEAAAGELAGRHGVEHLHAVPMRDRLADALEAKADALEAKAEELEAEAADPGKGKQPAAEDSRGPGLLWRQLASTIRERWTWPRQHDDKILEEAAKVFGPVTVLKPGQTATRSASGRITTAGPRGCS